MTGQQVAAVLERLRFSSGQPDRIVVDNGTEFTSKAVDHRAWSRGGELCFIRPGRPVENCYIESLGGRLRDECLNQTWFETIDDTRRIVGAWRKEYNGERPHSSLGGLKPAEFATLRSPTAPYDRRTPEA